ncbi:uncharacterized protein LOC121739893 [Aricia agestis]|uniref:uncharacterized protein LOC121739893 n=1 Tax=Aricia agestis TaxID=91739 RepID=UPI001C2081D9|nr:uncharacterized protein LOC121739893 [Aricia agestis]
MLLYFGILQVLLILSTECYSKNINHNENKTKNIQITIPITSKGIGIIRVDEIRLEDEYCIEPNVNIITTPINDEPEIEERAEPTEDTLPELIKDTLPKGVENTLSEPIDDNNNKNNDTASLASEEPTFEGPVRASGTINILGNFGPTMAGDPFIYPMCRPVPLYPIYPALNDPNSSESSEQPDNQKDPGTVNGGPYPLYRPVPLYPIFPSVLRESACSEELESTDPVISYGQPSPCPMYRPVFFPPRPLISNDPNQTVDPAKSKEPLTLNDDTRRLLRNLMLLNVAHQSNIPCEVVPIPPTNRTSPEDETEPTSIE